MSRRRVRLLLTMSMMAACAMMAAEIATPAPLVPTEVVHCELEGRAAEEASGAVGATSVAPRSDETRAAAATVADAVPSSGPYC